MHTFTQNATHNKTKMLHEEIWVLPHAPWYKNVQVQKKTNQNGECLWTFNFNKGGGRNSLFKTPS